MKFYNFLENFIDSNRFSLVSGMDLWDGKARPAAPIGTFTRFQAGFSSSEDFHRISQIYIDLKQIPLIFDGFGYLPLVL